MSRLAVDRNDGSPDDSLNKTANRSGVRSLEWENGNALCHFRPNDAHKGKKMNRKSRSKVEGTNLFVSSPSM
jgi:hypothetical protein